jgi:hypothetical protein
VAIRHASLRPLKPPEAYERVPRRVLGGGGEIRGAD